MSFRANSAVKRLKKHIDTFKVLHKCNRKLRKQILAKAPNDLVCALCECVHNVLNGNIPLSEVHKKKLARHKKVVRNLGFGRRQRGEKKKDIILTKRNILVQHGGAILPLILGPLLSVVSGLLTNI